MKAIGWLETSATWLGNDKIDEEQCIIMSISTTIQLLA